jgi:hypothetical protein
MPLSVTNSGLHSQLERILIVAYNTPELLKVGSAQALVLDTCDLNQDSAFNAVYASCREDNPKEPSERFADLLPF